jgi:pteridine reductase
MAKPQKIVLITGAARRIGADIARTLHDAGYGIVLHYHQSEEDAANLTKTLNKHRPDSAWMIKADFQSISDVNSLIKQTLDVTNRLDVLVNNASEFYSTPMSTTTEQQWDEMMNCNLKAPFFLSQAAKPALEKTMGCIVNIVDIYAKSSLIDFPVYSISKSGLYGLTQSLAKEMAPVIRVNGVSPGVILWPENEVKGSPEDVANAVLFLVRDAHYITGEVITVDGGKGLI